MPVPICNFCCVDIPYSWGITTSAKYLAYKYNSSACSYWRVCWLCWRSYLMQSETKYIQDYSFPRIVINNILTIDVWNFWNVKLIFSRKILFDLSPSSRHQIPCFAMVQNCVFHFHIVFFQGNNGQQRFDQLLHMLATLHWIFYEIYRLIYADAIGWIQCHAILIRKITINLHQFMQATLCPVGKKTRKRIKFAFWSYKKIELAIESYMFWTLLDSQSLSRSPFVLALLTICTKIGVNSPSKASNPLANAAAVICTRPSSEA